MTPKVIGLTGPTGGGKSTVCACLQALGCPVIDCDRLARQAVQDPQVLHALCAAFGEDILLPNGELDRRTLASRAFADPPSTARLNAATHPWIVRRMGEELERLKQTPCRAVLLDASQLFEANAQSLCDAVWVVTAPVEERLRRICARDGLTREQANQRVRAQLSDDFFAAHADAVIENADSAAACRQATALLDALTKEADA